MALRLAIAVLMLLCANAAANAHSYRLGDIAIGHLWAPPPAEGTRELAVYGPFLNGGDSPVALVAASSPVAESTRLRIHNDEGVTSWPSTLLLPPGDPVSLAPWHAHLWLSGLKRTLRAGDSFDLTLDFGPAGSITASLIVEGAPSD